MANMCWNELEIRAMKDDFDDSITEITRAVEKEFQNEYFSTRVIPFVRYDSDDERNLLFGFRTKWDPAIEFVKDLSIKYPKIQFGLHYNSLESQYFGDIDFCAGNKMISRHVGSSDKLSAWEYRTMFGGFGW